jgi:hypothetical protein
VVVVVVVVEEGAMAVEDVAAAEAVDVVESVDAAAGAGAAGLVVVVADTLFLAHVSLAEQEDTVCVASGFVQEPGPVLLASFDVAAQVLVPDLEKQSESDGSVLVVVLVMSAYLFLVANSVVVDC